MDMDSMVKTIIRINRKVRQRVALLSTRGVSSQKWLLIEMGNFAANQIYRIMYSSEDLERFYFQYQTEALPRGESLQSFCVKNKVPYNIFQKWFKDTRKK